FQRYYWNLMTNGEGYVGGGGVIRTRDFLKIGQAYLDGGVWNGHRIATPEWARTAVSEQTHISEETTGQTGDNFRSHYYDEGEVYAWHHIGVRSGVGHGYRAYHGNGNGGQLLLVVPDLDLVVMFTAGNYRQGVWNRERDDIVGEMIIPALGRGPAPEMARG